MQKIPFSGSQSGLDDISPRITEVFCSLQGEALTAGCPTTFIRLTGCPLRCNYCDTSYAFNGGERVSLAELLRQVQEFGAKHVCVTGGEPLAQRECLPLLDQLCAAGYQVSLETSGALDISPVNPAVSRVVDLKTPSSGEEARNLWSNLDCLTPNDQIKFVIANRSDYEWARNMLHTHRLNEKAGTVWFSPVFAEGDIASQLAGLPREMAEWLIEDGLPARLQLQLHKLLWHDARGR